MLKVKDSVGLKELEEFIKRHKYKEIGIWKRYDSNTGQLEEVYIGFQWSTGGHSYLIKYYTEDKMIDSAGGYNLNILYDLIKADLVEKVDDK